MTPILSNHFTFQLATGKIDFSADTFKIILMSEDFTFDKDSHATLSDVASGQIGTGYGYTQNDKTLANVSVTEDDANDQTKITWNDVTWPASGGSIGPAAAAVIYDETTLDNTVVGCLDFGQVLTAPDGNDFNLTDLSINLGV